MKRWRLPVLALVVLATAGLAAAPWLVPEAALRAALVERMAAATGASPTISGPVSLSLFPMPHVSATDVRIDGAKDGPPLLTAVRLEGSLRLAGLLMGRVETGSLTISGGRFFVGLDPASDHSWLGLLAGDGSSTPSPVGDVRLLDSALTYGLDAGAARREIGVTDVSIEWPDRAGPITVDGAVVVREEAMAVKFSADAPSALLKSGSSPIRVKATGDKLRLSMSGTASTTDGLRIDAKFGATTPSLRKTLIWLGMPFEDGGSLGEGSLQATASITRAGFSFAQATVTLDGNEAEGALEVGLAGDRIQVTGTLAADTIDLTRYADDASLVQVGNRGWREDPIDPHAFDRMDLDIRLSANDVTMGLARIGRCALSAVIRDGQLDLSLGEATVYGGTLSGDVKLVRGAGALNLTAGLTFRDVDLGGALGGFFGLQGLEGKGSGGIEVSGQGTSVRTIAGSLTGKGNVSATDGALVGIDLVDTLQRVQRRPLSTSLGGNGGRTPFDSAAATVTLANGVASSTDILLQSASLRLALDGRARIGPQDLALRGLASLLEASASIGEVKPGFELPFTIEGSWKRPRMEADAKALIRQSGAAAPLLQEAPKPAITQP